MTLARYENNLPDSPIRAIITYTGDDCGKLGPRFSLQNYWGILYDKPRNQLASFLNDATGRIDGKRTISLEVEKSLYSDFAEVLNIENGVYEYVQTKSTNYQDNDLSESRAIYNFLNVKNGIFNDVESRSLNEEAYEDDDLSESEEIYYEDEYLLADGDQQNDTTFSICMS